MHIRPCTSLDLPAIAQLHIDIAAELRGMAPDGYGAPLENMPERSTVAAKFRDMLDNSDNVMLAAEEDGRVVGFANGWREEHDDDLLEAPFMTIEYVEVHPDYRGRGIARELIATLEAEAAKRGMRRVDLLVLQGNAAALGLYGKLGYQPLEVRMGKVL